jgi:hypothetical protein
MSINRYVPFLLSRIMISGLLLGMVLLACTCFYWFWYMFIPVFLVYYYYYYYCVPVIWIEGHVLGSKYSPLYLR